MSAPDDAAAPGAEPQPPVAGAPATGAGTGAEPAVGEGTPAPTAAERTSTGSGSRRGAATGRSRARAAAPEAPADRAEVPGPATPDAPAQEGPAPDGPAPARRPAATKRTTASRARSAAGPAATGPLAGSGAAPSGELPQDPAAIAEQPAPDDAPAPAPRRPGPSRLLGDLARIGAGALVGLLLGATYGWLQPPEHRVSGEVVVDARTALDGSVGADRATRREVVTHQLVIRSQAVASEARRRVGEGIGVVTTRAPADSDVIVVSATASSPDLARDTLDASLDAYLRLLATRQREVVDDELTVLGQRADDRHAELEALDAALAATPPAQLATVVRLQSVQRGAAVDSLLDARERAQRLQAAGSELPVGTTRLDSPYAAVTRLGPAPWQSALLRAVLGAGVTALALGALAAERALAARRGRTAG